MKTRRMTIFAVASALLLVLALFASFVIEPMIFIEENTIVLPPETTRLPLPGGSETSPSPPENFSQAKRLTVTAENVQALIAALHKAESYRLRYTERLYYTGGQGEWHYEKLVLDGYEKLVRQDSAGRPETIQITGGGRAYIWPEGGATGYEGAQGQFETEVRHIEKLVSAPRENLVSVAVQDGENQLLLTLRDDTTEQLFRIDIASGLLLEYQQSVGGSPVYSYEVTLLSLQAPAKDEFLKPNGYSVFLEG